MREIEVPDLNISKENLQFIVRYNDSLLLSHCWNRQPRYGLVTQFGIEWRDINELYKDAEEVCHYFYQAYIVYLADKRILMPSHADEIFNQKINPFTLEYLQS